MDLTILSYRFHFSLTARAKSASRYLLALSASLVILGGPSPAQEQPSRFAVPETQVISSPDDKREIKLSPGESVVDFDISPAGPEVALLVRSSEASTRVLFWDIVAGDLKPVWTAPASSQFRSLTWHPVSRALFLLGTNGTESFILRLDETKTGWQPKTIYHTPRALRRLVVGPRPFSASDWDLTHPFYRLFFGVARPDKTYLIASVTEQGQNYYEVSNANSNAPTTTGSSLDENSPQQIVASSALPMAFHPAGDLFLWEDAGHCFQQALYGESNWDKSYPLLDGKICGGSVTPTPNGIGLLHWRAGTPGVELFLSRSAEPAARAQEYVFTGTPSSVPDGRGIVGPVKTGDVTSVVYVPIDVPLHNVANAWMFLESSDDLALFVSNGGLFRPQHKDAEQLYQLYDSEAYACGEDYSASAPTRPYFVTTDIFWENFAAAYEGLFILLERRQAIPAFWKFVHGANASLGKTAPDSPWAHLFRGLAEVEKGGQPLDPEAQRILRAAGDERSSVLNGPFDFAELKPRGHYTASDAEQRYFKAFRYLTAISASSAWPTEHPASELTSLPEPVQAQAKTWVSTYLHFIAPSRSPLLWRGLPEALPAYARHPQTPTAIFPLSWGFDNEVLLSTVFHPDWPAEQQIVGPGHERLIPSALDVAAALGNPLARTLLAPEIQKYPPLAKVLDDLSVRSPLRKQIKSGDLYSGWLDALGTSWAEDVAAPAKTGDDIWKVKRLQTGLASWATLRHATVLVNERTGAECGEGGFEWIVLAPPRGYVEPAPLTFEAIAGLFDAAAEAVRDSPALEEGELHTDLSSGDTVDLQEGVLRRLGEAAAKARKFADIARKELSAQPLSASDYEEILYVNRTAEYHFLIFKSLASPNFALSNPDPLPKTADVAGGVKEYGIPYLNAAVGLPLEWDQVVPYFGRKEMVKGSVYSYFEFTSKTPLDDTEWRKMLPSASRPSWLTPFLSNSVLTCPPKEPF